MKNKILYLLTVCICGCLSMLSQTDNAKVIYVIGIEVTPKQML